MVAYGDPLTDIKVWKKKSPYFIKAGSPEAKKYPGFNPRSVETPEGLLIEYDVAVTMRDGVKMYIDIYRPANQSSSTKIPIVIAWTPYGKHHPAPIETFPFDTGVDASRLSKYTVFEAPDPVVWCPRGYAIIVTDPRGCWNSEGDATFQTPVEGADEYDLIEWAAKLDWCNGKIGLGGVSYLVQSQWMVAQMRPPSLKAIIAWEGWSDAYRDIWFQGGIPETSFAPGWLKGIQNGRNETEDVIRMREEHPLLDDLWKIREVDLSAIDVPAFIVADWGNDLHTRGTLEAYKQISSKDKWLEVHGRKKWGYFYEGHAVDRQLEFFDKFLHGKDNNVKNWPKVRFEIRERYFFGKFVNFKDFPVPETKYIPLYLDTSNGSLSKSKPKSKSSVKYNSESDKGRVTFNIKFDTETAMVGYSKLRLAFQAEHSDADIFVALKKLDDEGNEITFTYFTVYEHGPIAQGCLRASHRAIDESKSKPYQPWRNHDKEESLDANKVYELDIELLAATARFLPGESLQLVIGGTDITKCRPSLSQKHDLRKNKGEHTVWTGPGWDAHLLFPVVEGLDLGARWGAR